MKLEREGFKFAKVILTKRRALAKLHQSSLKKKKQAILAQHRMSLQPKTTTTMNSTNVITKMGGFSKLIAQAPPIAQPLPPPPTSPPPPPPPQPPILSSEQPQHNEGQQVGCSQFVGNFSKSRMPPKRARSSLNRLVRQKSFEDSSEYLNQIGVNNKGYS
jgi:hypothetical protein